MTLILANLAFAKPLPTSIESLSSVWKTYQNITPKQDPNKDFNIVYGGQDISGNQPLTPPSVIA